jgi:two-component system sensor histidine kinase KdpD
MDALAHEFKTPLAAVQTASSGLLDMGGLTATQEDLVTLIDGEAIRLNSLCTRLLRTAKLDQARIDLDTDDVNVKGAISKALVSHSTESEINDIQVAVDEPGLTVRADRELFGMILTQFIDNARKYSRRGTPIEIAAQQSSTEVLISVHNFGPTIPIEDRERIFERFYRSPETKNIVPGTGIGLSAARKAAEANHGHVWVVSDDKEGTTFYLSLPNGVRGMR